MTPGQIANGNSKFIGISRRLSIACAAAILFGMTAALPVAPAHADEALWKSISDDVFGENRTPTESAEAVTLEAPYRAQDAAIVPITIRIPANVAPTVKKMTLIVEENPAPVVASFTFGEAAGLGERKITTRIRVDLYSNIRAVIETNDGKLLMATKYVKAAGGCSAPALKDMDAALANVGKMKVRAFAPEASQLTEEAQIMVRHPNYSGMQMNQVTGYYIPAKYVEFIRVMKGDELVFEMEGGISLSEDPNIRFTYAAGGDAPLKVTVRDTDGKIFETESKRVGS